MWWYVSRATRLFCLERSMHSPSQRFNGLLVCLRVGVRQENSKVQKKKREEMMVMRARRG